MLLLVLIGTAFMLWLWSRRNRNKNEPPLMSGSKILIGHTLRYVGTSEDLWNTVLKFSKETLERGEVLKTTIGPRILYVISDPEDFVKASNACVNKDYVYDFAKPWVGDGLMNSKPSLWKVHRKLLNPAFSQQVLDSFMDIFNSQSRRLVQNMKGEVGKGLFDQCEYIKSNALETICLTALGVDLKVKRDDNTEFLVAVEKMFNSLVIRFQTFWLHNNLLFSVSSLRRKQDKYIETLQNMTNKVLKQKKECFINNLSKLENDEGKQKGNRFKPFLELLLELSLESDVITDRLIREQVDTFIVAGHDTSATVIMFCLILVGSYPRVQEKIYEELKNIFCDEDRDVTKQDLSQLLYLEAVIKESMRFYPTVPLIGRCLEEDLKLRNYTLYKGNSMFLLIYGVNRHSMWGPDVEEFKPERWLDASTLPDFPNSFFSFGVGRRNCIGKSYAMTSMKIVLAHFFRSYIVHGDHTKLSLKFDVLLKPVSGHHISIEKRSLHH